LEVLTMRRKTIRPLAALLTWVLLMLASAASSATIEWEIIAGLNTSARPLDVAVSADGRSVFVLSDDGVLSIYTSDGGLTEKINLGTQAERIAVAPDGERLYVTRRQAKRVDVVQLDYVRDINTVGAPSKGREKAPVTIAVFSDFQ
jgi:DNA-binding beta-propeller fold protein YncE